MKKWIGAAILAAILSTVSLFAEESVSHPPETLEIEAIECEGVGKESCLLVTDAFHQKVGEKVSDQEVEDAKTRLAIRKLYSEADIILQKGSAPGKVKVVLAVKEANPFYLSLSNTLRFDTNEGWWDGLNIEAGNKNVLGGGGRLRLYGSYRSGIGPNNLPSDLLLGIQGENRLEKTNTLFFSSKCELSTISNRNDLTSTWVYPGLILFGIQPGLGVHFGTSSFVMMNFDFLYSMGGNIANYDFNIGLITPTISYGWDSEDDSVFPKSGSVFKLGVGAMFNLNRNRGPIFESWFPSLDVDFRKTWSIGEKAILSMYLGDQTSGLTNLNWILNRDRNILGIRFGYDVKRGKRADKIQDARMYLDTGLAGIGFSGGPSVKWGSTLGTSLNIRGLGHLNLSFMFVLDSAARRN